MSEVSKELEKLLISGNSRASTDFVVGLIKQKPELLDEVWNIYMKLQDPISRRAAWILDTLSEAENYWLTPYVEELIGAMPAFTHDAYKRHGLRILSHQKIPEHLQGQLVSICFDWLLSLESPVAVKMYCIKILYDLSLTIPAIRNELIDTIEFQVQEGTSGFQSIAKKTLKQLYSQKN